MNTEILDDVRLNLADIKRILNKDGKKIGINKLIVKNHHMIAEKSEIVKVKIFYKKGEISLKPDFPSIGNPVMMVSSLLFLLIFFFTGMPFSIFLAIICGQSFSFLFYYPQSNKLKKEIVAILRDSEKK